MLGEGRACLLGRRGSFVMASILITDERSAVLASALVIAGHEVSRDASAGRYDLALVGSARQVGAASGRSRRVVLCGDGVEDDVRAAATAAGATGWLLRSKSPRSALEQVQRLLKA